MTKTYKYKGRNQKNTIKLGNLIDALWHVHVHIMTLQRRYDRIYGPNISAYTMTKHITKVKHRTKPHWKQWSSESGCRTLCCVRVKRTTHSLELSKIAKQVRQREKAGLPHIKPRYKYNSMTFTQAGYKLEGNRIKIGCIDTWFTFTKHREGQGTIKTVTMKRDRCGDYWVCFSCDNVDDSEPMLKTGPSAGFDFGLKTYLTGSDGAKIASPQFVKRSLNKLCSSHKVFSRKKFLSNGWLGGSKHCVHFAGNIGRSQGNVLIGIGNSLHVCAGNMIPSALKP